MRFSPRTWLIAAALYTIYIIYGTLLPFDFSFSREMIEKGLANIEWVERYGRLFYTSKNVDAIANFVFFIPLGILLYNYRLVTARSRHIWQDIGLVTLIGLFLSSSIEFLQLLIKERTTSYVDMMMNSLGCFSGALIALLLPKIFSIPHLHFISSKIRRLPAIVLILPVLLAGLVLTENLLARYSQPEKIGNTVFNWEFIIEPLWIWQILLYFIPLGLVVTWLVKRSKFTKTKTGLYISSMVSALLVVAAMEILKALIYSAQPSLRSGVLGLVGIIIGITLLEVMGIEKAANSSHKKHRIIVTLGLLLFSFEVLILYRYSYPFEFSFKYADFMEKSAFFLFSLYSIIPFTGIEKLIIYAVQNILLFVPPGILLQELTHYVRSDNEKKLILSLTALLILCPILVQMFNYHQIPFLFEIPLSVLGLSLGYSAWTNLREMILMGRTRKETPTASAKG